jgi:hypothetical protein
VLDAKIWHHREDQPYLLESTGGYKQYGLNAGAWELLDTQPPGVFGIGIVGSDFTLPECNTDIYADAAFTTVYKAKTTTDTPVETEQLKDRYNQPLFWVDETHLLTTYENTGFPVTVYKYTEQLKLRITFEFNATSNEYEPLIIFGLGAGVEGFPDWGKGFIRKQPDGLKFSYLKQTNGDEVSIKLGDNGIEGLPSGAGFNVLTSDITYYVGYSTELSGTCTVSGGDHLIGTGTSFTTDLVVGDYIKLQAGAYELKKVLSVLADDEIVLDSPITQTYSGPIYVTRYRKGNNANDGLSNSSDHALATIDYAISLIPELLVNQAVATIIVAPGEYNEMPSIRDKYGSGEIYIQTAVGSSLRNAPYCKVLCMDTAYCRLYVDISGFQMGGMGANNDDYVYVTYCILGSPNGSAVQAVEHCYIEVNHCTIQGCDSKAVEATWGGIVELEDISGTNTGTGAYATYGGQVILGENISMTADIPAEEIGGGRVLGPRYGTTAGRPTLIPVGYQYFDTTISKAIWFTNPNWVDINGNIV